MMMSAVAPQEVRQKGLKTGALGTVSATVIGVASTAPAYCVACTVGLLAVIVGLHSPAIMLIAFLPMLFTAGAYYYLNRVDPDCGATFSWVTRAMGPSAGWFGGWVVVIADIVVMPSLAFIAAQYTYKLFGFDKLAGDTIAIMVLGCMFILAMTVITWLGIELSARTQFLLLGAELAILFVFSAWAIAKVYLNHPAGSTPLSLGWLNPFALSASDLSKGVLLAIFIYWGWDTSANVTEETGGRTQAGVATVMSTVVLVGIYVIAAYATTALKGPHWLGKNPDDVLTAMVGSPWNKLLILAVMSSAMASTQTTIMPTARTTLSMAAHRAFPKALAKIHPKYLTPTWSTWWMGIASIVWYILLVLIDRTENILWDTISGLGFAVAFYYGITALAAPVLFRKHLFKSLKNFLLVGVAPVLGALSLGYVFVRSAIDYWKPENSYTPPWFKIGGFQGIGPALVIGVGMLLLGIPLMLWARKAYPDYFRRKPQAADSLTDLLPDEFRVTEETTEIPEFTVAAPRPKTPAGG
jgi:amino acid transporter